MVTEVPAPASIAEGADSSPHPLVSSRRKATAWYFTFNMLSLGLLMTQGVVLVPLYLRHIDSRLYGAWLASGNIASYVGMLDLGVSTVLLQRVSQQFGSRDLWTLQRIVGSGLTMIMALALGAGAIGALVSGFIPAFVHVFGAEAIELRNAFLLNIVATVATIVVSGVAAVLAGLQRQIVAGITALVATSVGIVVTAWTVIHGWGLMGISAGLLIRAALMILGAGGYMLLVLRSLFPGRWMTFDRAEASSTLRRSLQVFAGDAAGAIASQSDTLIVASMIDPESSAILGLTQKATDIVALLAVRPSTSLLPGLAHLSGEGDRVKLLHYLKLMIKAAVFMGVLAAGGVAIFNRPFVDLWVGDKFYGGQALTILLCGVMSTSIVATSLRISVFALGETRAVGRISLAEALLKLPLSILLTRVMGTTGVVLGMLLVSFPVTVLAQGFILGRILRIIDARLLRSSVLLVAKALTPVIIASLVLDHWHAKMTLPGFILNVALYASFVAACDVFVDRDCRTVIRHLAFRKTA